MIIEKPLATTQQEIKYLVNTLKIGIPFNPVRLLETFIQTCNYEDVSNDDFNYLKRACLDWKWSGSDLKYAADRAVLKSPRWMGGQQILTDVLSLSAEWDIKTFDSTVAYGNYEKNLERVLFYDSWSLIAHQLSKKVSEVGVLAYKMLAPNSKKEKDIQYNQYILSLLFKYCASSTDKTVQKDGITRILIRRRGDEFLNVLRGYAKDCPGLLIRALFNDAFSKSVIEENKEWFQSIEMDVSKVASGIIDSSFADELSKCRNLYDCAIIVNI